MKPVFSILFSGVIIGLCIASMIGYMVEGRQHLLIWPFLVAVLQAFKVGIIMSEENSRVTKP